MLTIVDIQAKTRKVEVLILVGLKKSVIFRDY